MIVRMVIYKCRELNNPVTETLAAYVAQTTMNGCKSSHVSAEFKMLTSFLLLLNRNWKVLSRESDLRRGS